MTKSSQMKRRPRGAKRISRSLNHARLPQIQVVPATTSVMRFQNNLSQVNAGVQTVIGITATDLCAAMGIFATATHTGVSIWGSVKIKRIDIWGIGFTAAAGTTNAAPSVALRWRQTIGNQANTNSTNTDSSLSSAYPAYLSVRPPAGTAASFWNAVSQNLNLFDIIFSGVESMFVDIHVDARLGDDSFAAASNTYTTTFSVNGIYYPPLDGPGGVFLRSILPGAF